MTNIIDYKTHPIIGKYSVSFHRWGSSGTAAHGHNYYEIFLVTDGRLCHEVNEKPSEIGKGTLCMICPGDIHRLSRVENFSSAHMNICISPKKFDEICSAIGIDPRELETQKPLTAVLSAEEQAYFDSRASLISKLIGDGYEKAVSVICSTAADFISILNSSKLTQKIICPEWFEDIIEKIHAPEYMTCSAADVYEMSNFSPPVVIEAFKKYAGKTVSAYLRDAKCEYACLLLSGTKMTTLEISMQLGYYSLSHFNRVFNSYSGLSPAAYRREYQK